MIFYDLIVKEVLLIDNEDCFYEFNNDDLCKIDELVNTKYKTWDWNFGYSPKYHFNNTIITAKGEIIKIELIVKDGVINEIKIEGDYFDLNTANQLKEELVNKPHEFDVVRQTIQKNTSY